MRFFVRGWLRWLYPGMQVKRWLILAILSMGLFVVGLLGWAGKDRIRELYYLFPQGELGQRVIIGLSLLVGGTGFAIGVGRMVHSISKGVAPDRPEKTSALIYRTRLLERGPNVVALGGGTGLSTILRGLKELTSNVTAVVTVTDDGGSSGRLRTEFDVLPPGDVRNCILALAEDEERLARLFHHRFRGGSNLEGHALGNLLLVGMEQATGGFDRAIEEMSRILNVRGRVLPTTLAKVHLVAQMDDGGRVEGESRITADPRGIDRIFLSAARVPAHDLVLDAISHADLILLGPGSLYTSLIPNLLVEGVAAAIEEAAAEKLYIANLMTQPGETVGLSLKDHLRVLNEYVRISRFDGAIVNVALPPPAAMATYQEASVGPVKNDLEEENEYQLPVIRAELLETVELEGKLTVKHDPRRLALAIARNSRAFSPMRSPLDHDKRA
ncbi:MAG: gluconeogenesis factor YvcK family protein [Candidatus Bipolaricaulota bacterium]|nr:gluconeogenesis factor YvcK family protein [Candidatus Bipolaricaulota bacterium]